MKKSNFVALILGTIGVVFFALGMCMCVLPEWNMFRQGIIAGVAGLVVLLVTVIVWRRMEGKAPVKLSPKTVGSVVVGVLGALLLGVGMCLVMVFSKLVLGIVIGLAGIVILLMLIPLTKGIH
jgi:Zn-dependent protease with chaperone function